MDLSADVDLEDGELPSSEDEKCDTKTEGTELTDLLGCEDYIVPERPVSLTKAIIQQSTIGLPTSTTAEACKNNSGLAADYESDISNSSSASDSDEDFRDSKKRRMTDTNNVFSNAVPNDTESGPSAAGSLTAFQEAAEKLQNSLPKKVNNIWANVIQDEQASQMFNQLGVQSTYTVDRGSETYVLHNLRKRKRTRADSESSDISSGGLSDNTKEYLRSYTGKSSDISPPDTPCEGMEESLELDEEKVSTHDGGHRSRSKKKKKRRRERLSSKQKIANKLNKMDDREFANYVIYTLSEPKQALIFRIVSILGRETTERLFLKTLKIQRRGGLFIRNQQRLRTPGGVLLYLLRNDHNVTNEQVEEVFKLDRQQYNKTKKKELDKKRRKHRFQLCKQQMEFQNVTRACTEDVSSSICDDDGYLNSADEAKINVDDDEEEGSSDEDCLDIHCDPSDLVP